MHVGKNLQFKTIVSQPAALAIAWHFPVPLSVDLFASEMFPSVCEHGFNFSGNVSLSLHTGAAVFCGEHGFLLLAVHSAEDD